MRRPIQTKSNTTVTPQKRPVAVDASDPKQKRTTEGKAAPVDRNTWLTRNEASDLVGLSVQTLAKHERRGKLHPQHAMRRDALGVFRRTTIYDPKELAKLPRFTQLPGSAPGEIEARSFELFRQGWSNVDIVVELREPTERVRELREVWTDGGGGHFVISPEAQVAFAKLVGAFSSVAELLDLVIELNKRLVDPADPDSRDVPDDIPEAEKDAAV